MDRGLLVVFLPASFWLYGAIILAAKDWRWNLGRIILFTLLTGVGAGLVLTHRTGPQERQWVLPLFAATVFLPLMVQRCIAETLSAGRLRAARHWQRLLVTLIWRTPSILMHPLGDLILPKTPRVSADIRRRLAEVLAGIYSATSRVEFHTRRIEACVSLGHHAEAIDIYRRHFGKGELPPTLSLLCTASMACSEVGNVADAAALLRRAEELPGPHHSLNIRRFAATVRLYSRCGRKNDLEQFMRQHSHAAQMTSPASLKMWQGLAHLHAGELDRGKALLIDALSMTRPEEEGLRQSIQKELWTQYPDDPPPPLPVEVVRDLDTLKALRAKDSPAESIFHAPKRPVVTLGIVAAIILLFSLMEWVGSGLDGFTLVRFGANMPDLVKHGEWWRLMTSVFLHVDWIHLFFNVCACYVFGVFVERAIGRMQMLTVFLLSGLAGSLASALFSTAPISVGASGAVFGLLGVATIISLRFRDMFPSRMQRILIIHFLFIASINVAYGYVEPRIDNLAHGGGLAAGLLSGCFVARLGRTGIRKRLVSLAGIVAIILFVASAFVGTVSANTGGYPTRPVPMKRYEHPTGEWRIDIPSFWGVSAGNEKTLYWSVVFDDYMGAKLALARYKGPLRKLEPGPDDEALDEDLPGILGQQYEYLAVGQTVGERRFRRFVFQRPYGEYTYHFLFECAQEDADRYRWLVYRIVAGFTVNEGP